MRNLRKKLNVKEVEVVVYNTKTKKEETISGTVSEVESGIQLPEGCVQLSEKVISEKEVVYKMSPQDFVRHATIEE